MKLDKKKKLATRALKIGKGRISFNKERLTELKEAITKQDIKDLISSGVIKIKEKKGRKKIRRRRTKKRGGKIKKKVNKRKEDYIKITRKLRTHIKELRKQNKITKKEYYELRKRIKNKEFRSKAHLKEILGGKKWEKEGEKEKQIIKQD